MSDLIKYDELSQIVKKEDSDYLLRTAERLDMSALIQPHNPSELVAAQILSFQQKISTAVNGAAREPDTIPIIDEEILGILWMAYYAGALLNPGNIHIQDLCAGDGRASLLPLSIRERDNSATATCFDTNNNKVPFEWLLTCLQIHPKSAEYLCRDIRTTDLQKHDGSDEYWMARRPKDMTATIIKRLMETPPQEIPQSVTILPSEWYGYGKNENQIEETADSETWKRLAMIRADFHLTIFEALAGKRLSDEQELVVGVTERIMDCLRMAGVNARSSSVKGRLQIFPDTYKKDLLVFNKNR